MLRRLQSLQADFVLKIAVLAALAFTAIQSVIVPRGLYADGSYNLWHVLNSETFVVIGDVRTFAIWLNQLPVVLAMNFGVRDLDALIGFYTFGVAAMPIILWAVALVIQLRGPFFWQLTIIYSAAFLTSGFIAIGEYTYSFALVALAVSVLVARGPIRGWRSAALLFSALALVLCYEGMVFLGLPVVALAIIRIVRRRWVADGDAGLAESLTLWATLLCAVSSAAVAATSILLRSANSADTNLAGALNVSFAFDNNRQWRLVAIVSLLLMLSLAIRHTLVAAGIRLLGAIVAIQLFSSSNWAPAWLHYNTRSLAAFTFFALLVIALVALMLDNLRKHREVRPASRWATLPANSLGVAASVLFGAMSLSFWSMNHDYSLWLQDLRAIVQSNEGPVDIATTDLYTGARSQFSWGWTNPYLSALLQTRDGQGLVISHVETLENHSSISPASSPEFFERYYR